MRLRRTVKRVGILVGLLLIRVKIRGGVTENRQVGGHIISKDKIIISQKQNKIAEQQARQA